MKEGRYEVRELKREEYNTVGLGLGTSVADAIHGLNKKNAMKKKKAEDKRRKSFSAIQASIHMSSLLTLLLMFLPPNKKEDRKESRKSKSAQSKSVTILESNMKMIF